MTTSDILNPKIAYNSIDDRDVFSLIKTVKLGIKFSLFESFAKNIPFSLNEWSAFLHLSERTIQRYKLEKRSFDSLQSEKILEIAILFKKGIEVFGNADNFNSWLDSEIIALGGIRPKSLMDSSFGINLLKDELSRIEYGIYA